MIDLIFDATPFWEQLNSKGGIVRWQGGRYLEIPVTTSTNPTGAWLDEDGTVSLEDFDPDTVVRFPWAYYAINVTRKWKNDQINSGKAAISSMIDSKLKNTRLSIINDFENTLCGVQAGLSMYGLQDAVYYTGTAGKSTNTYPAGYSRTTYPWWANYIAASTGTPALVNLIPDLTTLINTMSQGRSQWMPSMLFTTQTGYELLEKCIEQRFRIVNQLKVGEIKFRSIEFMGIPIFFSPALGVPAGSTNQPVYCLNLDNFYLVIDPKYDFTPTPWKESINQPHTRAMQITSTLQLVCDRPRGQAVLTGVVA
jgi:hypothetical protein